MKRSLLVFALFVVLFISGCGDNSVSSTTSAKKQNVDTGSKKIVENKTEEVAQSKTPESVVRLPKGSAQKPAEEPKFDWSTAEINEENVRKALKDNVQAAMAYPLTDDRFRKFVSTKDNKGVYVEITLNSGIFANEKDFVKKAGGSLIAYSKILFKNPKVYEISVVVKIDNVGGGENEGVYISWRRENAKDVDYDAVLDNMFGDYTIPYSLARKYSIQKELYNGLTDFDLPQFNNL